MVKIWNVIIVKDHVCRKCLKSQKENYIYLGCENGGKEDIENLSNESCGIRSISRILEVSPGKVLMVIKQLWKEKKQQNIKTCSRYLLLSNAKRIYTDGLKNYKTLIPASIHKTGKYKINKIERNNLSVRTHL